MRIISIDTSTSFASAAIAIDQQIIAETVFSVDRTLSARLLPEIERMLAFSGLAASDIDLFACAVGPGSFTGVRAGVATIQGLALATGKPYVGFSTLALLATNFPLASLPVCPVLDARKSEIYTALYDCSTTIPQPRIDDCVIAPERFLERLLTTTDKTIVFVGEGSLRYREVIEARLGEQAIFAPFPHNTGRAGNGTLLALAAYRKDTMQKTVPLLPVYLRASEAEYAKMGRQLSCQTK